MLEDRPCLLSRNYSGNCEQNPNWSFMSYRPEDIDVQRGKRPLESDGDEEDKHRKLCKQSNASEDVDTSLSLNSISILFNRSNGYQSENTVIPLHEQDPPGADSDSSSLIEAIGRDSSISCLIRCSRSDYGSIASLNRNFRDLIKSGELYRLRRQKNVMEHWVYFSCHLQEWEAFDPNRSRWIRLPVMASSEYFRFSDKESVAVGTELLVFGKDFGVGTEVLSYVIYRYSLLTNSWSSGMRMNTPRCLFGSASQGNTAILAGGCDLQGKILSSAEIYNSESGTWSMLPSMIKPRKMCSGVFMDGKFYAVGGIGGNESKLLTCGEEFDLETRTWSEIPNMSPVRTGAARDNDTPATSEAPPLVAVVDNELYAADYADMEVRKYDKIKRVWATVGRLPERADSVNGWGLAFRACGHRLIVIGGPRAMGETFIQVNSWVPRDGPPNWEVLGEKQSGSFVFNCAVMGC